MNRVQNTKLILWLITGIAAAVGITRFIYGLGLTTNLTDATPWGFWIGFDVMAGVALAGGGFVITAIFYIMKKEEFHHLVKPAVLTAFLGYLAVIFGLLFDLGLPWNIWHMMIYWNPHSPLFEVGWCVMLYTTVLLLEFSPVPLEGAGRYAKIRNILMKFRFPLVMLGIMLSTLHQSSLGSLFLIMPFKLHELWYSSILPVQFFISAVALGLMIVSLESLVTHWLYRRKPETKLVAKLAKAAIWVLGIYLAVKLVDIIFSGKTAMIFNGTWESNLYITELLLTAIIPIILFSISRIRNSNTGQWFGSTMAVIGIVMNRLDVGGVVMLSATGDSYTPSWTEIMISLGVVSVAGLVFLFVIEHFHIWDEKPVNPDALPYSKPAFDHASEVWLGAPVVAARTKYSLAFILAFAFGFAIMPGDVIQSEGVTQITVEHARGGDTLFIDGNRDGYGTVFNHKKHADSTSCEQCHHMNLPQDKESGCWQCHNSMYASTDVFNHDWHTSPKGGKLKCNQCHTENMNKVKATAKKCNDCHLDLIPAKAKFKVERYLAGSYVDAMHNQCINCHKEIAAKDIEKEKLTQCANCHQSVPDPYMTTGINIQLDKNIFNHVAVPVNQSIASETKDDL